ncbi:MAG: YkgJ family cysteine cluster protein, partial [Halobacteriaceae archaeon]
GKEDHTATVFPGEIRDLKESTREANGWRDIARPMPYGLDDEGGITFEWALQTDSCGNCTFYEEGEDVGRCTIHPDRPLICETYPFSIALGGTSQPMGEEIDRVGIVRVHECDGIGRDIDRKQAMQLARALKRRTIRELREAIGVRENYESLEIDAKQTIVFDSEGPKHPDGSFVTQED